MLYGYTTIKTNSIDFKGQGQKMHGAIEVSHPSLRHITLASLDKPRSESQFEKLADGSLLSFVTSMATVGLTSGATLAPWPVFTRALKSDRESDM